MGARRISREERAHADQSISSHRNGEVGNNLALGHADRAADHRAHEQRGREEAAGRAAAERESRGQDFQRAEHGENLPGVLLVHGLIDVGVAGAHHLGKLDADKADQKTRGGGLEVLRPRRILPQPGPQEGDVLDEDERGEAANHAHTGVSQQLNRLFEVIRGDAKQGFVTQKPAGHDRAGNCREHNRAQNAGCPTSDDFLDDEQHGGDGRVECRRQSGCRAHRRDETQLLAREFQAASQRRSQASADL